jgi:hypothetical protein
MTLVDALPAHAAYLQGLRAPEAVAVREPCLNELVRYINRRVETSRRCYDAVGRYLLRQMAADGMPDDLLLRLVGREDLLLDERQLRAVILSVLRNPDERQA